MNWSEEKFWKYVLLQRMTFCSLRVRSFGVIWISDPKSLSKAQCHFYVYLKVDGGQLESLCYFDHQTHFMTCTVIILSCNHVLWLFFSFYVKVAQNSFQHFPRRTFWWVIITTLYQLMLQSWYQKPSQSSVKTIFSSYRIFISRMRCNLW